MRLGIVILRCIIAGVVFAVIGFFVTPLVMSWLAGPSDNSGLDTWAWAFQGLMVGALVGVAASATYSFIRRRSL